MITSADQIKIRPYLNAGMLVVRPQANLLNKWADAFLNIYQEDRFVDFSDQKRLYRIFIHQAVLSAVAISSIDQAEMSELSYLVEPVDLWCRSQVEQRARDLYGSVDWIVDDLMIAHHPDKVNLSENGFGPDHFKPRSVQ